MKEFKGEIRYKKDWCYLKVSNDFLKNFENVSDIIWTNNPHISVIKNELPLHMKDKWGFNEGEIITFEFGDEILTNGLHNWVICRSDDLCKLRENFELPVLKDEISYRVNFHLTLGKFETAGESPPEKQLRLTRRTHIDPETLYQFI
jgi:hypothetical protein